MKIENALVVFGMVLFMAFTMTVLKHTYDEQRAANAAQHAAEHAMTVGNLQAAPQDNRASDQSPEWYAAFWRVLSGQTAATWVLAVLTAFTLSAIRWQAKETARSAAAAAVSNDHAGKSAEAAAQSLVISADTLATNRDIERAYVSMSHAPPGLIGNALIADISDQPDDALHNVRLAVKVQNEGNTPAIIVGALLNTFTVDSPLPHLPQGQLPVYDLSEVENPNISLLRGNSFHIFDDDYFISTEDISAVKGGRKSLYVLGFVDYLDKFGRRHRAGYGRVYSPQADRRSTYENGGSMFGRKSFDKRNNLPYVSARGYNYDIQINEDGSAKS